MASSATLEISPSGRAGASFSPAHAPAAVSDATADAAPASATNVCSGQRFARALSDRQRRREHDERFGHAVEQPCSSSEAPCASTISVRLRERSSISRVRSGGNAGLSGT